MTAYQRCLGADGEPAASMIRRSDGAYIPADPANLDWEAYQAWLEAGNTPEEAAAQQPARAPEAGAKTMAEKAASQAATPK